jgi:Predicted membrane protein (DUF2142)
MPVAPVVSRVRSSPRAQWLITFALIAAVTGLWSLATPLFASADEPAHVIRAAAVGRGELTGRQDQRKNFESYVWVNLPEIYESSGRNLMCYAHRPNRDVSCHHFEGSETRTKEVITEAGRHPPAYYGLVGGISRVWPSAAGEVWLMRLVTVLITALFVTMSVRALLRIPSPRIALLALLVAITPMVLAFGGVVNPNSPETAAGIATWACGLVLVWELRRGRLPDRGLVTAVGISASALVLSRQISMFWVALIASILAGLLGINALRRLARSATARIWAVVVALCAIAQLAWILNQDALDLSPLPTADERLSTDEIVRATVGRSGVFLYEMIGQPGWLDVTLPDLAYLLVIVALGVLVLVAVAVGFRRYAVTMLVATVITAAVPVALEAWQAREYGLYWQGRYTLPFAVGVPLLAGFALQSDDGRRVFGRALIPGLAGMVVVAQVLAFYQALRRWSVGAEGPVFYWLDPRWTSSLPQWLLIVAFAVVFTAFVAWLLGIDRSAQASDDDLPGLRV